MPGPEFTAAAMNHGSETCSSTDSEPESEAEHTATDAGLGVFPNAKKGDGSRPAVVLVLLTAVFVFNQADRQLYSVLLPSGMRCDPAHNITTECIALDSTQQGLLFGPVFTVALMGSSLPISYLADRTSRVRVLAAGFLFWSLVIVGTSFVTEFWQLILCRMLLALGQASNNPAAYSLLADYFHPSNRAGALSLYHLGVYIGLGLSYMSSALASAIHWRYTLLVWGCPGLLLAAVVALAVKEPTRGKHELDASGDSAVSEAKHKRISTKAFLAHIACCPPFVLLTLASAVRNMGGFALIAWLATFYRQRYGLDPNIFGPIIGVMIVFGGGLGQVAGGYIADRLSRKSTAAKAYFMAIGTAVAAPLCAATLLVTSYRVSFCCLYFSLLFGETWLGTAAATVQEVSPPNMRARASAVYLTVNTLVGGFGPLYVGLLVNSKHEDHGASVQAAMLRLIPACYGAAAVLLFGVGLALRRYSRPGGGQYKLLETDGTETDASLLQSEEEVGEQLEEPADRLLLE